MASVTKTYTLTTPEGGSGNTLLKIKNVTIFEVIDGTTAGVYFGPKQIGFGVFPSKDFDQTLDLMVNDLQAYTFLKAQEFWTKEVNVADLVDKLSRALTSQKSLSILSGSTGYVQWNNKYRVISSQISLTLPSQHVSSHNASDTIEIWSPSDTTITFSKPGGTLVYIRDGDQTQPTGTLYKKTTITNPFDYYYFITVDYFNNYESLY